MTAPRAQMRMGRLWRRIAAAAALAAMVALAVAVPVHNTHLLLASLGQPVGAAAPEAAHHRHAEPGHAGGHGHHAASIAAQGTPGDADGPEHRMPRCPVCGGVQAATVEPPPAGPVLLVLREAGPGFAAVGTDHAPASRHFRPLQPRAPPIAG